MKLWFAAAFALAAAPLAAQDRVVIQGARVFDGTGARAKVADVLVEDGRIAAVGPSLAVPAGATRVDGRGRTLIPGLHDLHTHTRATAYGGSDDLPKAWAAYLLAGVTSINDFSVSGEMIAPIRALAAPGGGFWAPNLAQAVRFGVPGGHGTEYGWGHFFTMQAATPRAAHALTPLALSYDPDVLKVFADGWRYGRDGDLMSMNRPTLAAIVADAHKAGKPVVTHTVTLEGAKVAAAAGVDALGHGIGDALVDDELIDLMRRNGTAYVPTLVVYEPQETRSFAAVEAQDLNAGERAREARAQGGVVEAYDAKRWAIMRENIRRLRKKRILIGIGTDAGIGGVYHGQSAVRETIWLTRLGFTPAEALVAATSTSAAIMHGEGGHGTIAPGKRADLVLVNGAPDKRIDDLWNVERVWVAGREAPLAELRALRDRAGSTLLTAVVMTGPILTQLRPDGRSDLDTLPVATTDSGIDHSHLHVIPVEGHGRTFLAAQMGAAPRPFVQWVLPLTRGAVTLADARAFDGVEMTVRGTGDYRLILESYGLDGGDWFAAPFSATSGTVRLPFKTFASRNADAALDLARLRALRVELTGETGGTASLEVGPVRFYRD
ncbi:amidohydrolase family protein [Altererythrobacter aerius]|uniref:Amidohydrolase family protein n=1 Tax=Tsuneonella aeria TaxID=1837929 RepID=A0A6I4TFH3_9SPHN|nr:amidohydrolase family protein [Tsuneonella aeria]MXO76032.1 amidohydrolase family protein [Tsuneonella aeria]